MVSMPAAGGTPMLLATGPPITNAASLALSADGNSLFIHDKAPSYGVSGLESIYRLPVTGGTPTLVFSGSPIVGGGFMQASRNGRVLYVADTGFSDRYGDGISGEPGRVFTVNLSPAVLTITAPAAMSVGTGPGATACGVIISDTTLGAATVSNNCGVVTITRSGVPSGNLFPVGTTTIIYTANTASGSTATTTQSVIVSDNTPPTITAPPAVNVSANASSCTATGVVLGTPITGDNCGVASVTNNAPSSFPLGGTTVTWTVTDSSGNTNSATQLVTVVNPNPVVTLTGPASGSIYAVGASVNFTGTFTDAGGGTHTATWMFDTISQTATVVEPVGSTPGSANTTYTFTTPGVYLVKLTANDTCGGTGTAATAGGFDAMVVIYDPDGGFVTGGGWIHSPPGAYVPNPSVTGKANFGFVSKYHNGASVPTGNTEFQFKAVGLNFKSTAYEWLVVAGKRAQYKGSGTINGAGDYRFMLTVIDGDLPGGGGMDKFRIRIWNNNGGGLVYDNQMNAPDNDDPTTVLGGGSIIIHKP